MALFIRAVTLLLGLTVASISAVGFAHAAPDPADEPSPGMLSAHELRLAADAAHSPMADRLVGELLAQHGAHAPQASPDLPSTPVQVFTLTRQFVEGQPGVPVATLAHVATPVRTADGKAVTLFARNVAGTWEAKRASTGDVEARMAALLPPGARLLHEPQIDAWYALTGDEVRLLKASAGAQRAGAVYSVADFQQRVHSLYGDKLPGSAYDRNGAGGGYDLPATPEQRSSGHLHLVGLAVLAAVVLGLGVLARRVHSLR